MAWVPNQLPQNWFTGMVDGDTHLNIPITAFPELSAAEIDATTGDIRKLMYAILERCWVKWNAIAVGDRPTKMVLTKSSSVDAATGVITCVYTYTFKNVIASMDVDAEA